MNTKHLKAKILDLAIRGKIVPQDPSEGNSADLLQKIRDEKEQLIKQKKIKADKNSSFIIKADDGRHYEQFADGTLKDIEDEIPFGIPESWSWCKLSEISNSIIAGGDRPAICTKEKTSENTIPIYANAVEKDGGNNNELIYVGEGATLNVTFEHLDDGNYLINHKWKVETQ